MSSSVTGSFIHTQCSGQKHLVQGQTYSLSTFLYTTLKDIGSTGGYAIYPTQETWPRRS